MEFQREYQLPYTPAQIWAVLDDFENHRIWNPYVRIERLSEDPITIRYSVRMDPHKPKFHEVPATAVVAHPDRQLAIDVRTSFLVSYEESYTLVPTGNGTKLVHRYRCRGLFAWLRLPGIKTSFERMIASIDGILLSYLKSKYGKHQSPPTRPKPKYRTGRR
ncbi:SRPBCC family protein [Sphingopyxis sp. R3-92]|uniref:SRPBCC family protein n=1 Tax=Sphingopyxis sp. R3-92 TaxID=3158553 RepID=UPI003EE51AF0